MGQGGLRWERGTVGFMCGAGRTQMQKSGSGAQINTEAKGTQFQ